MNRKKSFFDLFIAVFAVVLILGTARQINLSRKTEKIDNDIKTAGIPAPAVLEVSPRVFTLQDSSRLKIASGFPTNNKQFDYKLDGGVEASGTTYFPILYVSTAGEQENDVVYCLNIAKNVPTGTGGYIPSEADAKLSYLAKTGLKGKQDALNNDTEIDYFATQIAVYTVLGDVINAHSTYDNISDTYRPTVQNRVDALVNGANNANFDIAFLSTGTKTLTKVNGQNYYESGMITVNASQTNPQITLSTTFNGATILNSSNSPITGAVTTGSQFKIRVPESSLSDGNNNINVQASITATADVAYKYTTSDDSVQPILYSKTYTKNLTENGTIAFTANKPVPVPLYSVRIKKVDGDGAGLAGASLRVKKQGSNDIVKDTWVTTTNEITIDDLEAGDYYIEEVVTPNGYSGSANIEFSLPAKNNQLIEVVNTENITPTGAIKVVKVDQDNDPVIGATIVLKNSSNTEVGRFTTTASNNEHTFSNLTLGSYTITEEVVPTGYKKAADKTVTVTAAHTTASPLLVNVVNNETEIAFSKVDENGNPLPGSRIQILAANNNVVFEIITGEDTEYVITKLPLGDYRLIEFSAPSGYVKTENVYNFTLHNGNSPQKINIINYKKVVKISKIDEDTNELIAGASLVVKDSSGDVIESFVTDGTVHELSGLANDTYTVEETNPPTGYAQSTTKTTFTIDDDSKEVLVEISNKKLVVVPPTSTSMSTILLVLGFALVTIGGSFIYLYVKKPQAL